MKFYKYKAKQDVMLPYVETLRLGNWNLMNENTFNENSFMNSGWRISFEKFPKRRAFIVINNSQSMFMQLVYLIINLSTMTHPDEWTVSTTAAL